MVTLADGSLLDRFFYSIFRGKSNKRISKTISCLALIFIFLTSSTVFAQVETNFSAGGAVRVGDSTTACAPAIEGAIRFDADGADTLDYCDGANWLSLLTSSVGGAIVNNGNSFAAPMIIGTNDTQELRFETNGTTRVTIDTSGNVGIGTTSPDSSLEISDSFNGENTILKLKNDHNASFVGPALEFEGTGDISMGKVSTLWDSPGNNSNMYFQVTNGGSLSTALEIFFNGNLYLPNSGWGSGPGDGKININDSTAAANTVIDGLVLSHADSDSGQGTSDGVGTRIVFEAETDTDGTGTEIATIVGVLDDTDNNSKDGSLRFHTVGANAASGTNTATERMRIDSSGNVGIGTTTPAVELDVNTGTINAASICDENNANCLDLSAGVGGGSGDFLADGTVAMTAPIRMPDGLEGTPSLVFSDDTGTGIYSRFDGVIDFSTNGVLSFTISDTSIASTKSFYTTAAMYDTYTSSSGSRTFPGAGYYLQNTENANSNYAGMTLGADNLAGTTQRAYYGVSTNSSGNTPEIVIGQQTGANAYEERIRIDSSGNVGIGTTTPAQALDVVGNIQYTGSLIDASDRRLKRDIASLENPLAVITAIEGVSFIMKDDPSNQVEYGVIAQQVEEVLPELVHTKDDDMGSKAVNYIGFIGWIIEAIKELAFDNTRQDQKMVELETKLAEKDREISELKSRLDQIEKYIQNQ